MPDPQSKGLILLAAGGTGGHLFPAEALGVELSEDVAKEFHKKTKIKPLLLSGVSKEGVEQVRCSQVDEQAAERAAKGHGQIERRQMLRRGLRPREFAVAQHAGGEERSQVDGGFAPQRK